jgi:hypothetical protein
MIAKIATVMISAFIIDFSFMIYQKFIIKSENLMIRND